MAGYLPQPRKKGWAAIKQSQRIPWVADHLSGTDTSQSVGKLSKAKIQSGCIMTTPWMCKQVYSLCLAGTKEHLTTQSSLTTGSKRILLCVHRSDSALRTTNCFAPTCVRAGLTSRKYSCICDQVRISVLKDLVLALKGRLQTGAQT